MKFSKSLPPRVGTLHFIGIGGIGMSGIAEVLAGMGYSVQGSDVSENYNVKRLREKGVKVHIGHMAANVQGASVVVVSSAIRYGNPELDEARRLGLPVVHRAEMLAEIMRFFHTVAVGGTHGKTTTTSMVFTLLETGGIKPTVINGGILNSLATNARMGEGEWMVVESDESDGSFTRLHPTVAIVTNMDPEHMEHYGTMDKVRDAYLAFVESIPFYGLAVLCADHPEVVRLRGRISNRRVKTYGFSTQADYRAENVRLQGMKSTFDLVVRTGDGSERPERDLVLSMPGQHNVQNVLAAIVVAEELGLSMADIRRALSSFQGVKRRFTLVGNVKGVTVVDDYGHHPTEIQATLKTARGVFAGGKVFAVIQPHRYTRLRDLMDEFATCAMDADTVVLAPVYAAGEDAIAGVTHTALAEKMRASGHRDVRLITDEKELAALVRDNARQGDGVICLGAGTISQWAQHVVASLNA
jgi:UDP-N-acetylmuramate--alanine ligase